MTTFKIDDDVPRPLVPEASGSKPKYPFAELKVGQSFFVPNVSSKIFANTTRAAKNRLNFKFSLRTVTENGVTGVRVWRIE